MDVKCSLVKPGTCQFAGMLNAYPFVLHELNG